jgi:hypothetical protein
MATLMRAPLVALALERSAGLPLPGAGHTRQRFARLYAAAAEAPSLGRLVEAHTDAVAILAEAGAPAPAPDELFGVWAARGSEPSRLVLDAGRDGPHGDGWRLRATVPWCSGAGLADRALVAADHADRAALVVISMRDAGVTLRPADWMSTAFADTDTRTVELDVRVAADAIVGLDDWYVTRPGFWHGAVGVAACWAGCASGLVERLRPRWKRDPHAAAHLGAIDALLWQSHAVLDAAADEIDASPTDVAAAHVRALRVRHSIDVAVAEITDRLQRALGPTPMAMTPEIHRIIAECDLYRRQCHAERDLEALGRLVGAAAPAVMPSA